MVSSVNLLIFAVLCVAVKSEEWWVNSDAVDLTDDNFNSIVGIDKYIRWDLQIIKY